MNDQDPTTPETPETPETPAGSPGGPSSGATPPPTSAPGSAATPGGATPPPPVPPPVPAPVRAPMSASDQRSWAMGAHLSALALVLLGGMAFLGPLVVWLVKKDEDPYVAAHGREALNFQLTWLIGAVVGSILAVVLAVVTIGIGLVVILPVAAGFMIAWLVFVIQATVAASRGEHYRYPLTVRLID